MDTYSLEIDDDALHFFHGTYLTNIYTVYTTWQTLLDVRQAYKLRDVTIICAYSLHTYIEINYINKHVIVNCDKFYKQKEQGAMRGNKCKKNLGWRR